MIQLKESHVEPRILHDSIWTMIQFGP